MEWPLDRPIIEITEAGRYHMMADDDNRGPKILPFDEVYRSNAQAEWTNLIVLLP